MRRIERVALLVAVAALLAGPGAAGARGTADKSIWTELPAEPTAAPAASTDQGLPNLSALVKRAAPAVVSIIVEEAAPVELDPSDPLHDFFERFYGDEPAEGLGTGFIIHASGLILTNSHVVEHASKIRVMLEDQGFPQEYVATVVGRDSATDLALIRVKAGRSLPVLPLGDSDDIEIADWVVAIGNPFGLSQSVTFGIISQTNRTDITPQGRDGYFDFIQTDASINPGNSGGPLLNLRGEVVAVNNAINASGQGIGFSVPINMAKRIIPQLANDGKVTRAWIGLSIQDVTVEYARSLGMKRPAGVVVSDISGDGPAAKAGIEVGDVILSWDNQPVRGAHRLRWDVACAAVGGKIPVELVRNGKVRKVSVEPKLAPEKEHASLILPAPTERLGLRLGEPDPGAAVLAGAPLGAGVVEVVPESRAAVAGLQAGDLIVAVGKDAVAGADELLALLQQAAPGTLLELQIRRSGENVYLPLRLPAQ
ncbi:trypsin-like peptidase domain-containing protein [Vulgatibacter sp.]|uniref:trypsin-like peptidase domain-containing protein n=1 Tax=Vulgatibacter sp. TaxID=1971226 RepID=UPI003566D324